MSSSCVVAYTRSCKKHSELLLLTFPKIKLTSPRVNFSAQLESSNCQGVGLRNEAGRSIRVRTPSGTNLPGSQPHRVRTRGPGHRHGHGHGHGHGVCNRFSLMGGSAVLTRRLWRQYATLVVIHHGLPSKASCSPEQLEVSHLAPQVRRAR